MSITKRTLNEINADPEGWAGKKPIKTIVKTLEILSDKYYNEKKPLVEDIVYDKIYDVLKDRDPKNKFLKKVGAPIVKGKKTKLEYFMPSLNKIVINREKDLRALGRWIKKYKGPYFVSDKLNGSSALFIKREKDSQLFTRGDGSEGTDISHLIEYLIDKTILKKLPIGTAIRGEIVCSKDNYQLIPEEFEIENPMTAVTSVINADNYNQIVAEKLEFIAHAVLHLESTTEEQMEFLDQYSFPHVEYQVFEEIDPTILDEYYKERLTESIYNLDGIVVFDNSKYYKNNKNGNPDFAFAFKNYDVLDHAEAKVIDVVWAYTKDSYVIPKVIIEPVYLEESTVTRATAFNAKFIIDKGIGKDAIVTMIKGGSIIPEIIGVVKKSLPGTDSLPLDDIIWSPTGVDLIYVGKDKDILFEIDWNKNIYFFEALKVKALGPGTIERLMNAGYKNELDIIDAYVNRPKELTKIKGFGEKSITKTANSILTSIKKAKLEDFMSASNLFGRGMGTRKLKSILDQIPNIMEKKWRPIDLKNRLTSMKGVGEITAQNFAENLNKFKEYFDELQKVITIEFEKEKEPTEIVGINFEKKIFVLTNTRDKDIIRFVEEHNGIIKDSFSSDVYMVIYKEGKKSNTYEKAKAKGIKLISDVEFKESFLQ